jgi:hypothetical protein
VRVFSVNEKQLVEYEEQSFGDEHAEKELEEWVQSNPNLIVEGMNILVVGQQVATNLNTYIDLLGIDREGNTAIVELKRGRTPRETLAQALEYTSFVEGLGYEQLEQVLMQYTGEDGTVLSESHRKHFQLGEEESVAFNKDQRIFIVGQNVSPEIRQTSLFLRKKGFDVTCVEFKFFETKSKEQLVSTEIVVGHEPLGLTPLVTKNLPPTNKTKFLESCDDIGRPLFERLLQLADASDLKVRWGSKGFSLRVDFESTVVILCYGFPPEALGGQGLWTDMGNVTKKVTGGADIVEQFRAKFLETGLFEAAGQTQKEVKWVNRKLTNEQINDVVQLFLDYASVIKEHGLLE